jgi:hypothetical protein
MLAIGDQNNDGKINLGDYPKSPKPNPVDGQLYVSRSVVLQPKGDGSVNNQAIQYLPSPQIGEMVYSYQDKSAYIYNGTAWIKQLDIDTIRNGPKCYVEYGSSCINTFTSIGSGDVWGWCSYDSLNTHFNFFLPPHGKCPSGWNKNTLGIAIICCK